MKRIVFFIAIFISPLLLLAQENKYEYTPKVKEKVEIINIVGEITLKNASGNAIVIESDYSIERPERAKGLRMLGAMEDNTNLGINVSEKNGTVTISGISNKLDDYGYTISIPQGIAVNLNYSSPFAGSDVDVDSYKGSLEIKTLTADVSLSNCTGPLTINSISGDIEAVFSNLNQSEPSSLVSVSGFVDVSVPADSKALFEINSTMGGVYNNLNLKSAEKETKDKRASGMSKINRVKGKYSLNGGGVKIYVKSVSGDIYLRKNK